MLCLVLTIAGCGGGEQSKEGQAGNPTARQEPTPTIQFVADRKVPLRWTKETYRSEPGRVELEVVNPSPAVHGVAVERSGKCCRQPGSTQLGYTKTIDMNETSRTVVTLRAGRYWAYCNVDGHWQGGMVSRLIVE
jgi:hypothetical protein